MQAVTKIFSFKKLAVVVNGIVLVDMWFHIGCCDVKAFHVTVQHMSCSHGMQHGGNKPYLVEWL
jgi:hypothetical protein